MTFDKPEHQQIVAQLINQASFPGHLLELAAELKRAVDAQEAQSSVREG